ncbi:hypothetical protein [Alteromonas sp. S015]
MEEIKLEELRSISGGYLDRIAIAIAIAVAAYDFYKGYSDHRN